MDDLYRTIFSRNIGLFTESEQETLRNSTIGIAGMGGIGGLAAERLIRLGVGQLKITDPGLFEESNLNRQFASSMLNLGQNKAEVVFKQIQDINPEARIFHTNTGIKTENDASLFVSGCDVVIDAMDFGLFREAILLQRAARKAGIFYLFAAAIGFGAIAVVFDPKGLTLEEYNDLPLDTDIDDRIKLNVPLERIVPVIPSYARDIVMIQEIIAGKRYVPTTSIGVGLASILSASEAANIILGKDVPTAPRYTYLDLVDRQFVAGAVS